MKNLHQEQSLGKSHRGFEKEDEEITGDEKSFRRWKKIVPEDEEEQEEEAGKETRPDIRQSSRGRSQLKNVMDGRTDGRMGQCVGSRVRD